MEQRLVRPGTWQSFSPIRREGTRHTHDLVDSRISTSGSRNFGSAQDQEAPQIRRAAPPSVGDIRSLAPPAYMHTCLFYFTE